MYCLLMECNGAFLLQSASLDDRLSCGISDQLAYEISHELVPTDYWRLCFLTAVVVKFQSVISSAELAVFDKLMQY